MSCRLRNYTQNPPGNFLYEQTGDKPRKFAAAPLITALAQQVSSYRTANNLPRPSLQDSLVDVDRFNAVRLGCDRQWTTNVEGEDQTVPISGGSVYTGGGCAGCGAKL